MSLLRELNLWAAEYAGALSIALTGLLVIVAVIFLRLNARLQKLIRRYSSLMQGVNQANLEALLEQQVELTRRQEARLSEAAAALEQLKVQVRSSLQRVGLVRYNAFDGVGGNQSFSLALLDAEGNGFVLSSLFGRSESAMYCKAVEKGRPVLPCSDEEEEAICQAMGGREAE
ncbi:MAG: DUF4446 family protein [Bacillota bacterium]|nr:DUF4446 family protein [Bacillota bacterium]